ALKQAEIVVLGVKPQNVRETLQPLQTLFSRTKPLLLSIAAGIRLQSLSRWGGEALAIVRVMPNTPAMVNAGASALCCNDRVTEDQQTVAESIMRSVGITTWVEDEKLLDAVTAVSGSGPAYFFYFMEILQKTAEDLGLPAEQASILTIETALGAAKMALESDHDPATLRQQVTSPGGTTEQALAVMQKEQVDRIFAKAVKAACKRSQELATILGDEN
ncbi:MAG TPA: pyrroline-5-carboxylate reductase, partial [Gammaproteobacteria bacterium]|nr:pyrroline-5-carboxylate reductase [Gammaproteobacteria bacterium]